jgi:acetolactate synthase-1/2/3 large subunit
MGFGLPAAIAAKIARPDLPVVCIVGDACFQMTCGELAVAKRLGLALPVVVLNDGWLSLIRIKQEKRQLPVYGTEAVTGPSWTRSSHYFGVPCVDASSPGRLKAALSAALVADEPTVIEATIDPTGYGDTVYD